MSSTAEFFESINEPFLSGVFEEPGRSYFYRFCCGYAKWFETAKPVTYVEGEKLYPGKDRYFTEIVNIPAAKPHFAHSYTINRELLGKKVGKNTEYMESANLFADICRSWGFTHGSPNYRRIVKEGLNSYRKRIEQKSENTQEEIDFKYGLLRLTDAMKGYAERCIAYLKSVNAPAELISALEQVPFEPARTYYEGLVCWNAIFYFDFCDNLGCIDSGLAHLYKGEDLTAVIAELFANLDSLNMWSVSIGPDYNAITRQALRAADGRRRPMVELRVGEKGVPEDIWDIAYGLLKKGCSNPSFYNDKGIHDMLHGHFPEISEEDLKLFCGCGCTETNLEGLTRAGGTDSNVNLLKLFENYLHRNLGRINTFEEFYEGYCAKAVDETNNELDRLEERYLHMSLYLPQPMRTLLFDDCIDKGKDFRAGGARYSWTMNSESGLINVIDCLSAVKTLYYDRKKYTAEEFLSLLSEENKDFYSDLKTCPSFGKDNDEVDIMGADLARRLFSVYRTRKPRLSFLNGFTLTEHQFSRYEYLGACVGPTPDGRTDGQPSCDSVAALRGKATEGPTAMLASVAKLPLNMVDGIPVVNVTLSKSSFPSPAILKGLVTGFFAGNGIQLQFTVTSAEVLKDAMIHPEKHEDLLVRVGGYSEYFNNLTPALKQTILDRDIHEV